AEDGIRDRNVTGVQTCALPIYADCDWNSGTNHWGCKYFNPAINLWNSVSLPLTTIFSFDSKHAPSVKKWIHVTRNTVCFKNRDWIRFWSLVLYSKFARFLFCCNKHCHNDCWTVRKSFNPAINLRNSVSLPLTTIFSFDSKHAPSVKKWIQS